MNPLSSWFAKNGDTLLTTLTTLLIALPAKVPLLAGLPWWVPAVTGVGSLLHTLFWPEAAQGQNGPPASKQSGRASIGLLATLLALITIGAGTACLVTGCKTTPTATQQAAIAVAVDIAVGAAVQNGSNDPAVWKTRAAAFEQGVKAIQAINAAGPTSLATLVEDLQPYIVKLGPADVLAANALVAALGPILQAEFGTNPTLSTTQQDIALVLGDVVTALAIYTGS